MCGIAAIANDVFVGSNTQLIVPVSVGNKATIGAASTIVRDAPKEQLTLSRSKQTTAIEAAGKSCVG